MRRSDPDFRQDRLQYLSLILVARDCSETVFSRVRGIRNGGFTSTWDFTRVCAVFFFICRSSLFGSCDIYKSQRQAYVVVHHGRPRPIEDSSIDEVLEPALDRCQPHGGRGILRTTYIVSRLNDIDRSERKVPSGAPLDDSRVLRHTIGAGYYGHIVDVAG